MTATDQQQMKPSQMTTFELRDLRQDLEAVLAKGGPLPRAYRSREELQERLDSIIAEQDDRAKWRNERS